MNLYEVKFRHYSPKDSQEGILTHLCADSDEAVYNWIRSEPNLEDGSHIFVSWRYKDDPEQDEYDEDFKERIINCKGEMYDDESEVYDLYYGAIQYGWNKIFDNMTEENAKLLIDLGMNIEIA